METKETLDKIDINEITAERMLDPKFAARVRAAVAEALADEPNQGAIIEGAQ